MQKIDAGDDDLTMLVLDTAMNGCSAGVWRDGDVLSEQVQGMTRGQAEVLVPMIEAVLESAGITYSDLDLIAVTKGPGAFTGLRIGLATAKALGLALDIPVCGVSTFEALLRTVIESGEAPEGEYYGVVIETKRDDYYFQIFDAVGQAVCDGVSASVADICPLITGRDMVFLGDAVERFFSEDLELEGAAFLPVALPSVEAIAEIAARTPLAQYSAGPLYIRPPDVSNPKTMARLISK
jgi:tRNA threonylcarbamoyladenosine biosynthesis protein TsaB